MKKILLLALSLFVAQNVVYAEAPKVQLSKPFDEPEDGWNKVLQLKNGNTFFFHFTKNDGIEVNVYGKDHSIIATQTVRSELWDPSKMKKSVVEGVYEIGGQPVIFLQQVIDRTPILYRIKFDANTGEMDGEKEICRLSRYKSGSAWAMAYGGVKPGDFHIEKDPNSDNYAVINFNSFSGESDERIEMVYYGLVDGKHKILSRSFYDAQGFKYVNYIGMTVDGNKRVFMCAYGYNTQNSGGKDSRIIISKLNNGDKEFTHKKLEFSDDFKDTKAIMEYNHFNNTIQLLTLTYTKSKSKFFGPTSNYYMMAMTYIDPETLYILSAKLLDAEKVSGYAQSHFHSEKGYTGIPQEMILNKDNTTTVLLEESLRETVTQNGAVVSVTTYLGSIGISHLDETGKEIEGYAINKMQTAAGAYDPMYVSDKGKGIWSYRNGRGFNNNAFMSFDYVDTEKEHMVLFNDYPENFEKGEDSRKKKTVTWISNANTTCYRFVDGKLTKSYLFGTPKNDDESNFCYIESSHFLKDNNTYATLMIERKGKKKDAHIAWISFE